MAENQQGSDQQQGSQQSGQQSGKQDAKAIVKKTIPDVRDAGGDQRKILAHEQHQLEQVKGGHYAIENRRQVDLGDGRTSISYERVELDLNAESQPHGL